MQGAFSRRFLRGAPVLPSGVLWSWATRAFWREFRQPVLQQIRRRRVLLPGREGAERCRGRRPDFLPVAFFSSPVLPGYRSFLQQSFDFQLFLFAAKPVLPAAPPRRALLLRVSSFCSSGLLELLSEGRPERQEGRRGHKQRRRREECFRVVKMSTDEKIDLLFEKLS